MSLLLPDTGLVFWMLIAFLVLLFVLGKYGFPMIVNSVDKRKNFIDDSIHAAEETNKRLANVKEESAQLLQKAKDEHSRILNEANNEHDKILTEAKESAKSEGARIIDDAKQQISKEKENMLKDVRNQVADLSVAVAEKILRKKMADSNEQMSLIERMLDELESK